MHAYSELYVGTAQKCLGSMFEWGCLAQEISIRKMLDLFVKSGLSQRFELGDASLIAGRSGVELGMMVLESCNVRVKDQAGGSTMSRSPEYWAGWVYAYYQWQTACSFCDLGKLAPVETVLELYSPYHEMDISQVCSAINRIVAQHLPETRLQAARKAAGLSQGDLSLLSGISVRTIQHYEQRSKDINKASAETVLQLARTLCCDPQEIMEPLSRDAYDYAVFNM